LARRSGSELAADRAWRRTGTEARILTAAADAFASGGYEATSMQAIAARAGVSVGLLYRHWASKEALFAAALVRTMQGHGIQRVVHMAALMPPAAQSDPLSGLVYYHDHLPGTGRNHNFTPGDRAFAAIATGNDIEFLPLFGQFPTVDL